MKVLETIEISQNYNNMNKDQGLQLSRAWTPVTSNTQNYIQKSHK